MKVYHYDNITMQCCKLPSDYRLAGYSYDLLTHTVHTQHFNFPNLVWTVTTVCVGASTTHIRPIPYICRNSNW